jgi:hypothetical protein
MVKGKKQGPFDRVRSICMAFPQTEERLSHGCPSFFAGGKKTIVMCVDDHHGDGIVGIWCAAPTGDQEALIAEDPKRFYRPPYVGARGWVGVRLDSGITDSELGELLETAFRCVAPKKLIAELDTQRPE